MTESSPAAREIFLRLERDPYFREWTDVAAMFTRDDVERSIALALGVQQPDIAPMPGAQERAMTRLALFQLVAPHLGSVPMSWVECLSRLSPEELNEVEALLGAMSLSELLE